MPVPSERPISGSRFAPKSRSAMRSRRMMCVGLVQPVIPASVAPIRADAYSGLLVVRGFFARLGLVASREKTRNFKGN
jgi:hypothetical protein